MAEVKFEAFVEGEAVDGGEAHAGVNLPDAFDPAALCDTSLIQEEISKTSGEPMKAPSVSIEPDSKDFPGSESIIPLSPQWLFSKHGDGKPLMAPFDLPQAPASASNGNSNDSVLKERRKQEGNRDADKRRDWWRTMATEGDGGAGNRRERWKEDERESNPLGRRDRWKESGDGNDRKVDRWAENSSTGRESAESRRTPHSERRSDSASRETTYDARRDSKWNTRWGPEDKEKETRRDKRLDFEKEGEVHRDKQHPTIHRNEMDKEMDTSARDRWRPHSITVRSKGDIAPPLSSTPPKAAPGFGIGRGRCDTMSTGFAVGRGRANLSGINPVHGTCASIGSPPGIERGDGSTALRYPRAKLLDIHRKCCVAFSNRKYPEGFIEVPQLTQADAFEPLAFFTPDMDEEVILEGILKGDVLTSGAVHASSKEQTSNRSRENSGWNRARSRTVGKEEGVSEANREDSLSGGVKENEASVATCSGQASGNVPGSFSVKEGSDANLYSHTVNEPYKQKSMLESKETRNLSRVVRNNESGAFVSSVLGGEGQESLYDVRGNYDGITEALNKSTASLHLNKSSEGLTRSHSEVKESNRSTQITPEELSLSYIDPQGVVQGPFSGVDIIDWFKAGFFGTDLMVRTADWPEDAPFTQLSKIMPHLQGTAQALSQIVTSQDDVDYQESNDRTLKLSKYAQQPGLESSGRSMHSGNLQADGGHFPVIGGSVDGRRDINICKVSEHERATTMIDEAAMLKRASSLPQRMAGLPQIQNDNVQSFVQNWSDRRSTVPEKPGLTFRNAGHPSSRAEFLHGAPEVFLPPGGSMPLERSWSDMSPAKETLPHHLPSHGLDAFQMHQLQQQEWHRVRQQLDMGLPVSHILQQQQHPRQQHIGEHIPSLGHMQHDLSSHSLQQSLNPRMLPRVQHQQSFPSQASESALEQVLRLQQQQQTPHAYWDQLLRQQQQLSGADHLHGASILTDRQLQRLQELSRTDSKAQQVLLLYSRQREHQARQHALLMQQQLASLHEQHISGVWEVDEFGQFVQTQVPNPMQSPEAFHQQQSQRHQSFSPMQHLGASHGGVSGGHVSQLPLSRSELRKLADLEMQKNLASLLDGTTSMPAEMLVQLQSEIRRFEAQHLTPDGPFKLNSHNSQRVVQNPASLNGDGFAGRVWNAGHDFDKQQVKQMPNRGVEVTSLFDQLSTKSELPAPNLNWQQDPLSLQTDSNRRLKVFAANADESLESVLKFHDRSEKTAEHIVPEDISRVLNSRSLSSHSLSGHRGSSPSSAFHDQQVMSNLWAGDHVPLNIDSSSAVGQATQPQLFELAGSTRAKNWDMDWSKTDMSHAGEFPSKEAGKIPMGPGHDLPGLGSEARTMAPALLHDGGNLMSPNGPRDGALNNNEDQNAASFLRSGSIRAEDFRELLPSPYILGDPQQAREDDACSRLSVWSSNVKNQAMNSLKEIQEVPRAVRNELEGVPLSSQGLMQVNDRVPSMVSLPGSAVTWQRASSPSLPKSPAPPHHGTTMRSVTPGDDEFFWDHKTLGNARQVTERHDKLSSRKEQIGKIPDEGFMHQAFAAGSAHMLGPEFSSTITRPVQPIPKPVQPIPKGLRVSKQLDDMPVLKPQGSLTVDDVKDFREWCEEQINVRRGLNESTSDYQESGPAFETLKAEFLRNKDSIPAEDTHASLPAIETALGENMIAVETDTLEKPKKSSEGEEEPDSESSGQNSALKNLKKKAKKSKKIVDPSLLGFSVASNRILMGEIQHVDD